MVKLAKKIGMTKLVIACGIVLVVVGAVVFANLGKAEAADAGANYVNANYCESAGNGIKIIPWYVTAKSALVSFNNGCKNTGHGMRNYTYTCLPRTQVPRNISSSVQTFAQYLVSWKPCGA